MEHKFTSTEFSTVQDKIKFYNQFIKFVESDYNRSKFPKWFYNRLSMTFGHIAHYNQDGFYNTFFTTKEDKKDFINQCLQYGCYGQPEYTYCDVEKALQSWIKSITYQQLGLFLT